MDELLQEFIAETRETLAALASEIVAWEADPGDRARLDAIFRFVHTVKGSCGFLDLPRVAKLSHDAESALAAVRDGRRVADTAFVNAVLAIVDRIGELVESIDAGQDIGFDGDELLTAALSADPATAEVATPPADAPRSTPLPSANGSRVTQRSVRLPVDLLDRMMNGMSEMVLARNELARTMRDGEADLAAEAALERLSLTVADMRDTVSRTRMQTIEALFAALPRMVRDTASQLGKQVVLTVEGGDVEIDREMIEAMRDPLTHIIRNAIDHGIEAPNVRTALGKPAAGRLKVTARQSGNTIVLEVADDGAGIDTARVVAKYAAVARRDPAELARLSERQRAELIFEPGLSSRDEVSAVSGRGVGMDVVRANVEQIGGRVELVNDPGRGLAIVIQVPLTLSILPTIILGAGEQRFAIARQSVEEIIATNNATVRIDALGDASVATVRGTRLALVDLPGLLGVCQTAPNRRPMLVIVAVPGGAFALAVDSVLDSEELVVRPAAPPIMTSGLFAGQTLPDTGVPMLVLDGAGIAAAKGIVFAREQVADPAPAAATDDGLPVLLFIDLDGIRRAVPVAAVDRIEELPTAQIAMIGGQLRFAGAGEIVAMTARGPLAGERVTVIRLRGATGEVAYGVRETIEIVSLAGEWRSGPGLLGIALHDDHPIEIIDPTTSLEPAAIGSRTAGRPVCVLSGDAQQWTAGFLAPFLEKAGYDVTLQAPAGEAVTVLAMADEAVDVPVGGTVVRLSERPDGGGIFCYDRSAVLAALGGAR